MKDNLLQYGTKMINGKLYTVAIIKSDEADEEFYMITDLCNQDIEIGTLLNYIVEELNCQDDDECGTEIYNNVFQEIHYYNDDTKDFIAKSIPRENIPKFDNVITLQSINDIKINSPFSDDDEQEKYINNIIVNLKSKGFKFPDE